MAKRKIEVFLKFSAERQITAIAVYIEQKGYPFTAEKFAGKLYQFAESLATAPFGNPLCRNVKLAVLGYRCAVFQKWIFIYKVYKQRLTIYRIIHGSRMAS
ncbi:MAG: type II toxin-antitoxin system RelE/ParE family toxin [Bacteroidetes bacterium]|nr:type II toxin-antitoxin system RelE/ParE family toxin [Bacteroidota bacterium]